MDFNVARGIGRPARDVLIDQRGVRRAGICCTLDTQVYICADQIAALGVERSL